MIDNGRHAVQGVDGSSGQLAPVLQAAQAPGGRHRRSRERCPPLRRSFDRVRDVLRLRVFLLGAQALFLWWGVLIGNMPTVVWNGIFLLINAGMIARIAWERRPITMPEEARDIYESLFTGMRPRDFLMFCARSDLPAGA